MVDNLPKWSMRHFLNRDSQKLFDCVAYYTAMVLQGHVLHDAKYAKLLLFKTIGNYWLLSLGIDVAYVSTQKVSQ
jgi:hypothetical protein